ncbi:MAG: hypothetical protein NTZ14_00760 [Hyphomicrobiales bacterium]|nr:hypothetical protein [Hyphomicrobiales bacterium]
MGQRRPLPRAFQVLLAGLLITCPSLAVACDWPARQPSPLSLEGITVEGDMLLSDGSRGRLPGLRVQPSGGSEEVLSCVLSPWSGAAVALLESTFGPDRRGRVSVAIVSQGPDPGRDLALNLLESGFAMVWPADMPPNCRIPWFETQAVARRGARGLWAGAGSGLMDAIQGQVLAGRAGEMVVMQGHVSHVGQTRRAAFLNFGARGTGASAELRLLVWRDLERKGWTRDSLRGQPIGLRGVVRTANPARMLITDAGSVETMD